MSYGLTLDNSMRFGVLDDAIVRSPKHSAPPDMLAYLEDGNRRKGLAQSQVDAEGLVRVAHASLYKEFGDLKPLSGRPEYAALSARVKRALVESKVERLERLEIEDRVLRKFIATYNGVGLKSLVKWFLSARISDAEARSLLAEVVEDGLIATFYFVAGEKLGTAVRLREQDLPLLQNAFAARIPLESVEKRIEFAEELMGALLATVVESRTLRIDGGEVRRDGRSLVAVLERDDGPLASIHSLSSASEKTTTLLRRSNRR